MNQRIFGKLPGALLPWYDAHKRDLPWRQDQEPYHIWISEIMLQQTRVEAVKGYYTRFLQMLPTIGMLANADEELLYKLWEGLGYYSRVRNLKKAAQVIMERHRGSFPREYREVLALPGIGEYTAGAICSIAFSLPTPAVDGNVLRVVARLTDDTTPVDLPAYKRQIQSALAAIYPAEAGVFTQALMELGATICGPNRKPDCENCPCGEFCLGYARGTAAELPVKQPKRPRKTESMTVFIFSCDGKIALKKRSDTGLLAGLWELPHTEGYLDIHRAMGEVEALGLKPREIIRSVEKKHVFTHIEWHMNGYYVEVAEPGGSFVWLSEKQLRETAALPTAFRQFLSE